MLGRGIRETAQSVFAVNSIELLGGGYKYKTQTRLAAPFGRLFLHSISPHTVISQQAVNLFRLTASNRAAYPTERQYIQATY